MTKLVLTRHGETAWNEEGRWGGGHADMPLSERGRVQARVVAAMMGDVSLDVAYTSELRRAQESLEAVLLALQADVPTCRASALNGRAIGSLTGQRRSELERTYGAHGFQQMRRGWDVAVPGGESLREIHARVARYFHREIVPQLFAGHSAVVVAHSDSLRALAIEIEQIPPEGVDVVEFAWGELCMYEFDAECVVVNKERRISR
jgi:2,3-bisphosphoglycerate-dependent phosphoglycerate mutase